MAQTLFLKPQIVLSNAPGINTWQDSNNLLLLNGKFASSSGPTNIVTLAGYNLNIPVGATINNIIVQVKGYRGSFDTTLNIYAVDTITGIEFSFPYTPPFQGFNGVNTLYTLSPSLFDTTWDTNKINNIQIKLIADGELHIDSVLLSVAYVPASVQNLTYNTLVGGPFILDEIITGGTSGATAVIVTDNGANAMTITEVVGVFQVGETITGGTSGATAIVTPGATIGEIICHEFVQAQPFQLSQAVDSTSLFMMLESFSYPNGDLIQYADFYGGMFLVIDQGKSNEENVRGTNVLHDFDGTGKVKIPFTAINNRGLEFKYPYTYDANLVKSHTGTAEVVISNSAPFYDRFLKKCQIGALINQVITIKENGISVVINPSELNFIGNVIVTNPVDDKAYIEIQGGHIIQDDDVPLPNEPALNFKDFFTVTDVPGVSTDVDLNVVELANDNTFITNLTNNPTFQADVNNFITGGGGGSYIVNQTPDNGTYGLLAGDVEGVNTTFTVESNEYLTSKLLVFLDGLAQLQGATDDFVELDPATGTFVY